jgi:hypothetical protein
MREITLFKLELAIARPYLPDTLKRAQRTRQRRTTRYSLSHSPKGVLLLASNIPRSLPYPVAAPPPEPTRPASFKSHLLTEGLTVKDSIADDTDQTLVCF